MTDRDQKIIDQYRSGIPICQILKESGLTTRGRIYQILRRNGVPRGRRMRLVDRDKFLGVSVPAAVKEALKAEANRRGVSVSELSSESLKKMLIACGYPLEAERLL